MEIIVQRWIESEQGWGQRLDGLSIHFSKEQLKECVKEHSYTRLTPQQPVCYSYITGEPFTAIFVAEHANEDIVALALRGKTFFTHENNPSWLRKL